MAGIARRGLLAVAALGGVARHAWPQDATAYERDLHEAAKRDGQLTWYTGQHNAETAEAIGRAFTEH